ncbi:hypothetical protein ACFWY9_20150 [Amycolatopsis sp. NPDC059027]|uniref:hypothetical protein n=1 Tax=unclassified Amycolatopsis TaxID=2618356 RepID=UPI00366C65F0
MVISRQTVLGLVAVLVVAAAIVARLVLWTSAPALFTIAGTVKAAQCAAGPAPEVPVEVVGPDGTLLSVGTAQRQACSTRFSVPDVPAGQGRYGIRIEGLGDQVHWKDEDESRAGVNINVNA